MHLKHGIIILKYRRPWLRLVCSCKEECAQKNRLLCSKGVHQRKSCKYCRFERCQSLAGLERKWVISGHLPMAENSKRSKSGSHTEWSKSNKLVRLILVAGKSPSNEKWLQTFNAEFYCILGQNLPNLWKILLGKKQQIQPLKRWE